MTRPPAPLDRRRQARALVAVKMVHTIAWVFLAGAVIAVPISAAAGSLPLAAVLAGIVVVEIVVLALNDWHCPLTAVAARYTTDRRPNFDIYLPEWLARHNKGIFGTLFGLGTLYTVARALGWLG